MKIEIEGIGIVEVPDEFGDLDYSAQENYVAQIKEQINAEKSSEEDVAIESDAEELSLLEKLQGGARGFAQGLTFGFADEIEAGLKTGGGFLGDYSKSVKQIRDDIDEVRRKAPGLALGSELTGAVLPSLAAGLFSGGTGTVAGLGATGARVASGAAKAQQAAKAAVGLDKAKKAEAVTKAVSDPSLLKSIGKGAGIGAGYGGLYGVGTAEGGLGERAIGGATGAALGGVTGGAVPLVAQGGLKTLQNIGKSFGVGGQKTAEQFSDVKILQALERDGLSRQGAIEKLQLAEKLGQKDLLIADLGEDLAQLGFASQAIAGGSRKEVSELLEGRAMSQAERISDDLIDQSKLKGPFSTEYVDELAKIQEAAAGPAYRNAYKVNIPANTKITRKNLKGQTESVALSDLFTGPRKDVMIIASKQGKKILGARGETVPDLSKVLKDDKLLEEFLSKPIPTQYLHAIKRGLDDIIEKGTDSFGKVNSYGAAVTDAKVILNKLIEKKNPAYAKANKDFSDIARLKDSFNLGLGNKKMSTSQMAKILKSLNESEKEAFRVGLVARMKDQSLKAVDNTDFTKRIFGSPEKRSLIRMVFPKTKEGKEAYQNFKKIIDFEKAKVQTRTKVTGGSPTAARQEAIKEAAIDPTLGVIGRAIAGDVPGAARQSLAAIGARAGGLSPEGANQIARKLFLMKPADQIKYLQQLGQTERKLIEQSMRGIGLQTELTAGAGMLPGLLTD
jgi:hypothetical protein